MLHYFTALYPDFKLPSQEAMNTMSLGYCSMYQLITY